MEKDEEQHSGGLQVAGCGIGHRKPTAVSEASCGLAVVLSGGRRIEVARNFDVQTFERLVNVLKQV